MTVVVGAVAEDPADVIGALHELIDALDRRMTNVTRVGESLIRTQAADLRSQAVRRIEELTRAGTRH